MQQNRDLWRKGLLANPGFLEDLKKCRDVDGLYKCAAVHGIDVRTFPKLLFPQLCHSEQPIPVLLHVLEDAALGTPGNLNYLLNWILRKRKGEGRLRKRINLDDMVLLQQWMRRQLSLGLKTEKDILVFLRFVSRISDASSDESLRCNLIISIFEGLQSSSVFAFKDLGTETQRKLLGSVTRGPVTRQSLDLGFDMVEAMRQSQLEGTDQNISMLLGGIFHAYASLREHEKQETRFLEVIPRVLEMIGELPQDLACSLIYRTTKALINDHFRPPAVKATTMQLLDTWWSALAKIDVLDFGQDSPFRNEIEILLSTRKPEVVVPYLQQLDDRNKALFILRYWVGPKTRSGRSRARYLFDEFYSAKGKCSPWVSMFQAVRECAQEDSRPLDANVKLVFKVLQMLRQSEDIVEVIKQARKLHAIIDESDVVYTIKEHLREQPLLAARMFHFYPRLRLQNCPELAERMILNPRSHPNTAVNYMQSRQTRVPVHREEFRQLRKQLLDKMALAYSTGSHLTTRMAFRNVHKCYVQYTRERLGRPSRVMARAFTRAVLIRRLQAGKWVSTMAVRWVVSVIRSTESIEVANEVDKIVYKWRLANNEKFRVAALAMRRDYATDSSLDFQVQTQWSKYYRCYEKVYTPLKIPRP